MFYRFILLVAYLLNAGYTYALYPQFNWARSTGGISDDEALSVVVDAKGNTYTTGYFTGTIDFDAGPGTFFLSALGYNDMFILKTDAEGNFVWAKAVKGTADEWGENITLDATGNIYITGFFADVVDFDPGTASYTLTADGEGDIFVLKLDMDGNFKWARKMGGRSDDNGSSIAIDAFGDVLIGGYFSGIADLNPGAPDTKDTAKGGNDFFIAKLDGAGNFIWAKRVGGTTNDHCNSMATDMNGNVYATGNFSGTVDFDPGKPKYDMKSDTNSVDIFILKLDKHGIFQFAKRIGGYSVDNASALAVDTSGHIVITGFFSGTVDFDPGPFFHNITSYGDFDIFISRLDTSGQLIWVKHIGGDTYNFSHSLALDRKGNIYITGAYSGNVDFDPDQNVHLMKAEGMTDMFILALDASGKFSWVQGTAGSYITRGLSVAVDSSNHIYTAGAFSGGTDFDPAQGHCYLISAGDYDLFIHKTGPGTSDIRKQLFNPSISFYPNPCNDMFNVRLDRPADKALIEVYNALGTLIHTQALNDETCTIDLSNAASGIYVVKVISNGNLMAAQKVVKQ